MPTNALSLRVLLGRDGDWFTARSLDHDIAVQAKSLEDLRHEFARALAAHIYLDLEAGIEPLSHVPQAPAEVWQRFNEGLPVEPQHVPAYPGVPSIFRDVRVAL